MKQIRIHPWPVRLMHWLNAQCMVCMFMSGWAIYNASPLLEFRFPVELTVGGWLAPSPGTSHSCGCWSSMACST